MRCTPRAAFVLHLLLQSLFWTATPGGPEQADAPGILRTQVGTFDLKLGTPPIPDELRAAVHLEQGASQHFVLAVAPEQRGFDGLRDRIVGAGGAIVGEAGNSSYLVRLNLAAYSAIASHPLVVALEPYHPAFKLSPMSSASEVYTLHVAVFPGEDAAAVAATIRDLGGNVLGVARDMVRAQLHRSRLPALASVDAVRTIGEEAPIVPWGEETTTVVQTGVFQDGAKPYHEAGVNGGGPHGACSTSTAIPCQDALDCPGAETCVGSGSPEVLMILDTGIQLDAGDLSNTRTSPGTAGPAHRKVRVYETTSQFSGGIAGGGDDRGCDDPGSGGSTHGHVVASVALGNATQVPLDYGTGWVKTDKRGIGWRLDGVAPRAVLVAYDALETPPSGLCANAMGIALAVGDTYTGEGSLGSLEVAYHTHGARTFNFSWGTVLSVGAYGTNATRIDDFLSSPAHPDAMLFLAAGDLGRDYDLDGVPDPQSIYDPATAKNAVVVGASGNVSEPFNDANEQDRWGNSSVGPANTPSSRVVPILMAPGTDFGSLGSNMGLDGEYACRSSDNDQSGSVECDVVQGVNGTSFASAAAAGAALLVRDYLRQGFYPDGTGTNPGNASDVVTALSGALVKAILIASADWMDDSAPGAPSNVSGDNLFADYRFNNEQGYGRIQLTNVLPLQTYSPSPTGLLLADGGIAGGRLDIPGLSGDLDTGAGETDTGTFTVCDDAQELRVALVWIDSSGNVLNRNLDLELVAPSGKVYFGNYFTDDDNRNFAIESGEDCPNAHITGSQTGLDASPWSLETCANSDRDNRNPTEAIFLSADPRLDGTVLNADKQTEAGTWTIRVRTGAGSTAALQPYVVVAAGGVCLGSSVLLDQGSYVCNEAARIVVDEKDEAADPQAGLSDAEIASRTTVEVVDPGPDGSFGSSDDLVVDREDATSGMSFTHTDLRFVSAALALTDGTAATEHNGTLDVRDGQRIRAWYRDESGGVPDPNKTRLGIASVRCGVYASIGGVLFAQFGMDSAQLVEGGCERDARSLFTFGFPDRYMDSGETIGFRVAFQSAESVDLVDAVASLRCVLADPDSPEGCRPGTRDCPDPERKNNPPCGSLLTILDSPKTIGDLPAGQIATPSFSIRMGTIAGTPEVDMILGVSARKSGRPTETLFALRNTLNVDEQSYYYSTDFPSGGTEIRDWPALSAGSSPSNEVLDNPTSSAGDPSSDYRFDTMQFSSLQATGRNLALAGPWNFESGKQGFTVGLNNTSTPAITEMIANWGEDRNFNGVLDYVCTHSPTTACPGVFPYQTCGRCSNDPGVICVGSDNALCGGGATTCTADTSLGTCFSSEDRDPVNGVLDDNWGAAGGCGWQTNGTTNNPNQPGGVWHTGKIGSPGSPCLVNGPAAGACQSYETLTGTGNLKIEYEVLLSPQIQKVNQCTTDLGPLPPTCGGRLDTQATKVFQVEFTSWAWNMALDFKDRFASLRWELDTDTTSLSPVDLLNDSIVLNALTGSQGPVSVGNSPLTDGYQAFAPFATSTGGASQNGVVGKNRVGRNPCYFEVNPLTAPFHFADPLDDDLDNDSDGQVDEYVAPNGPLRNFDTTRIVNSPADMRYSTLEDIYGPSGESFQGALGFRVLEGNADNGAAQTSFGAALDDMVLEWREFTRIEDAEECFTSGSCATLEVSSGRLYEGNGALEITVTDPSPYRCTGGAPCSPEGKNDCDHNGSFADVVDDNDCDDDGVTDVLVRASRASLTPDTEWAVLNRVAGTDSYRGSLPYSTVANALGVLFVVDVGGLNPDFSVRYDDSWDGSPPGSACQNAVDPAQRGVVSAAVDLLTAWTGKVVVRSFRLDDVTGDGDGFPDTGETVDLYVTLDNQTGKDVTHLVATLATTDPKVDCLLRALVSLSSFPAGATLEVPVPFSFRVSPSADRAGGVPPASCDGGTCSNGAGSCGTSAQCQKTVDDDYLATFTVLLAADQFDTSKTQQNITVDMDLDSAGPVVATSTFIEGFELGFGNFTFQNLDVGKASNSASDGYRCQYNDPDFINSNSYGDTECYLGFISGQLINNHWHSHSTVNPDGGRAYLGTRSLHYGVHTTGDPGLDTYGLSQMDAMRTKSAIHLAARVCRDDPSPGKLSCNTASDCVPVGGGPCVATSPELSFKHQVSTADNRHTGTPDGHTVDRCVVAARLASGTIWQKLYPFQNVYDAQGTDNFSNCTFDPIDDGSDEDDYFDPTDPNRRLGPSSTCFPEFVFSYLGDTRYNVPFAAQNIGRASDGPGLQGSLGNGTWVESKFDLTRYRGRSVLIRYLFTSIKVSDVTTLQDAFRWNPIPDDDGWYVDDVRVTDTLGSAAPTVTADTADNGGLPGCGSICGSLTVSLAATPAVLSVPGRTTTLSANANADRCTGGLLLLQFWLDGNGDGMLGDPSDRLLRDYGIDPVFQDAPDASASYVVRVRCSTATGPPCDGVLAAASITVGCPGTPFDGTFDPVAWWANLTFTGKETLAVPDPGFHPRFDVARGDLGALRSTSAFGGETCVVRETYATTFTDPSNPLPGSGYYYLVRDADPVCNDNPSWSTYHPQELEDPAPGRRRDNQVGACSP